MMDYLVFSGGASKTLAQGIVSQLGMRLGMASLSRFSDGEISAKINESVRGKDVFVIQSTNNPAAENLMELMLMIDALKRASTNSISVIMPYFGYARQDRATEPRVSIGAKLVANLLTVAGVDRIVTMDLHATQIQGFFDIPVDNLYSQPVIFKYLKENIFSKDDCVIVSPDAGGVTRARSLAKRLNAPLAIIDKRRSGANQAKAMHVIGEVEGKRAIIVDDMIDTAGTLSEAANALKKHGAVGVVAVATHGVLSGPAIDRITAKDSNIDQVIVTDTIDMSDRILSTPKITVLSVTEIFANAIDRINNKESISSLFNTETDEGEEA